MTTAAERRQQYADMLASAKRHQLEQCPSFPAVMNDWKSAISEWRARQATAKEASEVATREAKQSDEVKRHLRDRRHSDFLMADALLKQAHEELDSLLSQSGQQHQQPPQHASLAKPANVASHSDSILASSRAPTDVTHFDARLPHLVPPSYYAKAVDMVLKLDPRRSSSVAVQRNGSTVALAVSSSAATTNGRRSSNGGSLSWEATVGGNQEATEPIPLRDRPRPVVAEVVQALGELIDALTPNHWSPVLFQCRAACHFVLSNVRLSLRDSVKAIELCQASYHESNVSLAWRRSVRAHVVMLDPEAAKSDLRQLHSVLGTRTETDEDAFVRELIQYTEAYEHKLWSQALLSMTHLCTALSEASLAAKRAELLVTLEAPDALDAVATATLQFPSCSELWYWYARLQLRTASSFSDVENASRSLQRSISLAGVDGNPEAKQELQKVRYLESKSAMAMSYHRSKRWRQAVAEFTILITLNGVSKGLRLHFTSLRAKAFLALGRPTECISDATFLLNHAQRDEDVVSAYLLRSEAHAVNKSQENALRDARCACSILPQNLEAMAHLRNLELRTSGGADAVPPTPPPSAQGRQQHDHAPSPPPRAQSAGPRRSSVPVARVIPKHYEILGVGIDATTALVTRAYREAALKWHPDRWMTSNAAEKLQAEDHFKQINAAYQTLVDDALRSAYNRVHGIVS